MSQERIAPPAAQRILCVDDDPDILQVVRLTLENEGFLVATAASGPAALEWIRKNGLPHLAVVDLMMPGMTGLELCQEINRSCDLPFIFLSAVDDEPTVIRAIDTVAEDYVVKPFRPLELAARVRRVLRRLGDFSFTLAPVTTIDANLAIDFAHQEALVQGRRVTLTPIETKILHILMRSARRTVRSDFLLRRVWPLEEVYEDTLRVHVHRLRHKIEPEPGQPRYLITQRGAGYSFFEPA
ncbi:MAG TPA: response regulator transcription factor [Thermoanaerobaculia bacterium]|nr:response regulator transcription factor [Thermoanaerobaculia bacterium]